MSAKMKLKRSCEASEVYFAEVQYNHWSKGGKRPLLFLDLALGP